MDITYYILGGLLTVVVLAYYFDPKRKRAKNIKKKWVQMEQDINADVNNLINRMK